MLALYTLCLVVYIMIGGREAAQPDCPANQSLSLSTNTYLLSIASIAGLNVLDGPNQVTNVPSRTNTMSWTEADLRYYNYFSAAMYCPSVRHDLTCCLCGQFNATVTDVTVIVNSTYATWAMITVHPSKTEIVVTFRGSVAIANWLLDLTFAQDTVHPGIKIHRGFFIATMSVYDKVTNFVLTALKANPTFRVVVGGHSLGGAMASLFVYFATSRAEFPPRTVLALATYGQPRTGNKAYAHYMNSLGILTARVVSRADIVPHAIPVGLLPGIEYVHHSQEIWANGEHATFCSKSVIEDWTCSNSVGPAYAVLEYLQYFNIDYSVCYFVDGHLDIGLLSIPGAPDLNTLFPPLPPVVYKTGGQVEHRLVAPILSVLG